jgi:steroid delta-isomerase-like uncharacterized protein
MMLAAVLAFVGVASTGAGCLHADGESEEQRARRRAAVQVVRHVNTMEHMGLEKARRFVPLGQVPGVKAPDGFQLSLVTDGKDYTVTVKDTRDPCGFAFVSDSSGLIYEAQPIKPAGSGSTAYAQVADVSKDTPTGLNEALVRRWIDEGFNKHHLDVVDELFAESFAVNGNRIGREGLKQSMTRHLAAFPDLHVTIDDMIAEGGKVGIWYTVEGTHEGEFEAVPASGKRVKWSGFDLLTIERGRINDGRFISDTLGLLRQLGATVSPSRNP